MKSKRDLSILIVEDDFDLREILEDEFTSSFTTVYSVGDGVSALNILKNKIIDVVISDMSMPMMNGMQLLTEIKKVDSKCMVIFMTGDVDFDADIAQQLIKYDGISVFKKPFNWNDIIDLINKSFKRPAA